MNDCKHYRGCHFDKTCLANVNMRELVGGPDLGWAIRLPCTTSFRESAAQHGDATVSCPQYREMTDEELAAEEAETQRLIAQSLRQMEKLDPLITAIRLNKKDARGQSICPCCGGVLRWSIAGCNDHMVMQCETEDCVSFME